LLAVIKTISVKPWISKYLCDVYNRSSVSHRFPATQIFLCFVLFFVFFKLLHLLLNEMALGENLSGFVKSIHLAYLEMRSCQKTGEEEAL